MIIFIKWYFVSFFVQLHATSAGMKAFTTQVEATGVEVIIDIDKNGVETNDGEVWCGMVWYDMIWYMVWYSMV